MANALLDTISVDIDADNCIFKASGYSVKFDGFTVLYEEKNEDGEENQKMLPLLATDDVLKVVSLDGNQHFTQPPPRFTEATLIKTLEENGIGRPSTYAPTITTILARMYVEREGKQLKPTALGEVTTQVMKEHFQKIVDADFTAKMETELDNVEQGTQDWVSMLEVFYKDFAQTLETAEEAMEGKHVKIPDEETDIECEKCGRKMVIKIGPYGKFLACPGFPSCRNTKSIVENVGVNCPECGKPLIYRHSKTGKKYISCSGYPECKFISWNVPTGEKGTKCGKHLEYVYNKSGKRFVSCSNKECDYKQYGRSKRVDKKDAQDGAEGGNTGAEDQEV
jgi:DNA topoisomerase-1